MTTIRRTVRRADDLDQVAGAATGAHLFAPAPTSRHRPAPAYPAATGGRVDQADRQAGKPRTQGRPQPEYPREGYGAYRLFGRLPSADSIDAGDNQISRAWRLLDWLLGRPDWYLYCGITCRDRFVRWVEHSDSKTWAGDVNVCEAIEGEWWPTLRDTVTDGTGRPYLVFDRNATADDGIRPIRPGELVDTEPVRGTKHGEEVDVYTVDSVHGVTLAGAIVEGARTGEKRLIQAWDGGPRPIHNVEHNEGAQAVNRVAVRHVPRLVAVARRQAVAILAAWSALAVAIGWTLADNIGTAAAALAGFAIAAVVLQLAQLVRLAGAGAGPKRRRRRKPAGSKRRQRGGRRPRRR